MFLQILKADIALFYKQSQILNESQIKKKMIVCLNIV